MWKNREYFINNGALCIKEGYVMISISSLDPAAVKKPNTSSSIIINNVILLGCIEWKRIILIIIRWICHSI